jgi:alanyl-tRNA synthetase
VSGAGPTERLYYTDAYLPEFTARVVDIADDGKRVYLDRTAFYPTSGGQQHDLGALAGQQVVDVIDEDDRIAHVLSSAASLNAGQEVSGKIDWTRRFDHMQQHTGQHLLSAVFEDLLGAKTVSVHFGDATSTLDVEADSMSQQSVEKAERRANLLVAENRPVTVGFEDAAAATGLRKPTDRSGSIRIVTIADLDRSACGGTHIRSTGEIGSILIRGTERTKKAMRIEFVCGLRGVARARADHQALSAIAASLSTALDAAPAAVASQASQLKEGEQLRRRLEKDLARYRAAEIHGKTPPKANGVRVVVASAPDSMDNLRTLAQALLELDHVAFVGTTPEKSVLVAASEDSGFDAGKVLKEALAGANGKGGGSPRLAQGSPGSTEVVAAILAALERGR